MMSRGSFFIRHSVLLQVLVHVVDLHADHTHCLYCDFSCSTAHLKATKSHEIRQCYLPPVLTQVNAPRLDPSQPYMPVHDLPTPQGWKAELTLVLVIYLNGSSIRIHSPIHVITT